ncbi:MAG: Light-sensor Protein kinase [Phylliscum demangeonii]|nr:MAG: Light-sensor Protein kinase [Phylliscum demangeonii]
MEADHAQAARLVESRPPSCPSPSGGASDNAGSTSSGSQNNRPTAMRQESESPVSPGASDRVFPIRSVVSVEPTPTPPRHVVSEYPAFSLNSPISSSGKYSESTYRNAGPVPDSLKKATSRLSLDNTATKPSSAEESLEIAARQDMVDGASRQRDNATGSLSTRLENARSRKSGPLPEETAFEDDARAKLRAVQDTTAGEEVITARFKHVITSEGHAVITGRDGETLQRCEDEPIHIPGAVQGFGLLVALREEPDGKFPVRIVSENVESIIGYSAATLFALESFCDLFSESEADTLLDHIEFIKDGGIDPAVSGPEVFILSIQPPDRQPIMVWCAMHINDTNPGLILCEFELDDDHLNPLSHARAATPDEPEDTLKSDPTAEELAESTNDTSKPLRMLRSARKRKGEAAAMEVFNIMAQVQEQLASAPNLDRFLKVLVGVVKELTGFHRVMIYQFDQDWNGRVVTELVDPRATKDLYKGLNFPASDIPKQARDLYKINKVRLLYDRDQQTARLVCRTVEDMATPLDLTYSNLRAMSPIHIRYLANMAVRASMSISINAFNELWGLISCHSYGSKGMRVSFAIRKMCRLVGESASRNIERLSYASRLQARKLINTIPTELNHSGYIIASSDELLQLFDADFGLLAIRNETKMLGKVEESQEALVMLEYLRVRQITSVLCSQDITQDFPDLRYPPGFRLLAGLLLVPLSAGGDDFIVFFRKCQSREVRWAGNPYEKFTAQGTEGYLEPRKSFKIWTETITGKCKEWTEEQIETAAVLCLVYGKFIAVWRQKEAVVQSSQLRHLLLANSAHEVRTPLNAIVNYLEIALEGHIDPETREYLSKSHSASKSLVCVINDLLDLTKTEQGRELIKEEDFDLSATVREATDMFVGDAKRKGISLDVHEAPGLPQTFLGDQRRVRQVISNVIANAVEHTAVGGVSVEVSLVSRSEGRAEVSITVEDSGRGMSPKQLDALCRDMEQVQTHDDDWTTTSKDDRAIDRVMSGKLAGKDERPLGLGLAVVARIIRTMGGQLRLKSEEGKGSRFVIQLSFFLPPDRGPLQPLQVTGISNSEELVGPKTPVPPEGELTLIDHASPNARISRPLSLKRHGSAESGRSLRSARSQSSGGSARSDVDKLIDAIQEPFVLTKKQAGEPSASLSRRRSVDGSFSIPAASGEARGSQSSSADAMAIWPRRQGRAPGRSIPGAEDVTDSATPIKAVRMVDYNSPTSRLRGPLSLPESAKKIGRPGSRSGPSDPPSSGSDPLSVLVAEDDPINSKIIGKRLGKLGNRMPIVDGLTSTKMIRSIEKSNPSAAFPERVPIFAVSASLEERNRDVYIDAGFDGWILKPIDFKRLRYLLDGIIEPEKRRQATYAAGKWEGGGWFTPGQLDVFAANTHPSG